MSKGNQNNYTSGKGHNGGNNTKNLCESDFKSLVQNCGQIAKEGNAYELKSPTHDNQELQKFVKHPEFKVKPLGNTPKKGETCKYELSCGKDGQKLNATVCCK